MRVLVGRRITTKMNVWDAARLCELDRCVGIAVEPLSLDGVELDLNGKAKICE